MSIYSKQTGSPYSPLIDRLLGKNKKYYYSSINKENSLKEDIDSIIHHLVNHNVTNCEDKQRSNNIKYINNKISISYQRNAHHLQYLPKPTSHSHELKKIEEEISKYLSKMSGMEQQVGSGYVQFVKLSEESKDYLEYYLKNNFKSQDNFQILHSKDNKIILSMLKNNYKCLTRNPQEISNRILLSLSLNPLNDFHFVDWPVYSKFRKLATGTQSKSEGRVFLVNYFLISNKSISKEQFKAILGAIMRKLQGVMNRANVERLIQRMQTYIEEWVQQRTGRQELQKLMIWQPLFMWQQLLMLIFTI